MKKGNHHSRRNFIKKSAYASVVLGIPGIIPFKGYDIIGQVNVKLNDINIKGSNLIEGYVEQDKVRKNFSNISIDTNFENGNLGQYIIQEPDTIYVGPVSIHKDTWFSFRIRGVKHKKINLIFEWINNAKIGGNYAGQVNNTAMITYDGKGFEIVKDVTFAFKDPSLKSGNYIQTISHIFREDEALVSYCAPWSNTRLATIAMKLKSDQHVQIDSIGNSKLKNLPLTYFKITDYNIPDATKKKFFLIAREDSYEAGGSWATEGILRFILSDDPVAKVMLRKMVFIIFPIFSVDGVAIGSTNYPLNQDNSEFVYLTSYWNREQPYYEIKLMKDFWTKLKNEEFEPDVCFKLHSTCYWECHFRPEDCSPENLKNERELLGILRNRLSWRIEAGALPNPKGYMNYNFIKIFPNAITFSSHNDFIFTSGYLKSAKVYRRHEDVLQDGELIARCFAEFYGISKQNVAPYLMAGDVDKNCGIKGSEVTYSVYYYDINELPPTKIEVIINNKAYPMICNPDANFKKPVKFSYRTALNESLNNYCFIASNGMKERKIPEEDYLLPGPFILM